MGKCKTEAIQTDFITLSPNQAYPEIIQAYSKPYVTLAQRGISRTLTYSKSETYSEIWYIQNPGMFRHIQNPRLIQTSTMKRFVKMVNGIREISFAV